MKKTVLFKNLIVRATAALLISCGFCSVSFAEYNAMGIPDSTEIRQSVLDSWLKAPFNDIRGKTPELRYDSVGNAYQVRCEENDEEFYIAVAPQVRSKINLINGNSVQTIDSFVYNMSSAGGWVLYRKKSDGKASKIRLYFNPDPDVYFQIRPAGTKSYIDLIVYGHYCVRSSQIGLPFEKLYSLSFQEFYNLTCKSIPWEKVTVTPGLYSASNQMIGIIRQNLDRISYVEDAAYSDTGILYSIMKDEPIKEDGKDVFLTDDDERLSLCSAGFLKWIVDGIVEPFTLKRTDINVLCQETVEYNSLGRNGVLSQVNSLSFSLDWCRNLSCEALNARSARIFTWKTGGVDVNSNNFVDITGYMADTGYSMEYLKSILYVQGITEPGYFYLAAIKQPSKIKPDGYVFDECAVIFPYFDDAGKFACSVFLKGIEMTLEDFMSHYVDSFVHLNRVKAAEEFYPR